MRCKVLWIAGLMLAATAGQVQAAFIDTTGSPGGWSPFGESDTATYGQTFTTPTDNVLNSFSLYLSDTPVAPVEFYAYIYAWDGVKASGPALFQSTLQSFIGSAAPTEFSFLTGGITLATGSKYVAFLNARFDGIESSAVMPGFQDNYSGGEFVYFNNGNDFGSLTTNDWDYNNGVHDAWFKASFSSAAVPEPASLAMWGLGAIGLMFARRKRQQMKLAA